MSSVLTGLGEKKMNVYAKFQNTRLRPHANESMQMNLRKLAINW